MTELDLIVDLQKDLERQGPGSAKETLRACEFMNLPSTQRLKVADIGCGTGGQTLSLAQNLHAQFVAVDLFPEFLERLKAKSKELGLADRIETLERSMNALPFKEEEFDIIWSEGAIYNIGFEKGIKQWKKFLKKGGYLAVSEITWITDSRPEEIGEFWNREYPEIDIASNKIKILEGNGYTLVGYFYLEPNSWIENYYQPLEAMFGHFLERNHSSDLAQQVVKEHQEEFTLYKTFKDYYSYGFYIARKN